MNLRHNIQTALHILNTYGISGLEAYVRYKHFKIRQKLAYRKWVKQVDTVRDEDREALRRSIDEFPRKPLISIILPVYDVDEKWLRKCIDSVRAQLYDNWELCIADDFSLLPHVRQVLEGYRDSDERIKVAFRTTNGHISAASNTALELVTGKFTVLLDHDDELSEDALFYVVKEINEHPDVRMIYSDEDLIDTKNRRSGPKFKPDWSRDLFYSANLITHLSCYETSLLREIGGFTIGLEGSQDYDLALRAIEEISESQIRHIPRILYHWRVLESSVASSGDAKPYAHQAARDAIASHLKRTGKEATVSQTVHNLHRVNYVLPDDPPKTSLILSSAGDFDFTLRSIKTFAKKTAYRALEIIIVCPEKGKGVLEKMILESGLHELNRSFSEIKVLGTKLQNESEMLNLAVSNATGDVICFADLNLEPVDEGWLDELVSFAVQEEIGAVGAKLLNKNGTVLHGGLLIGVGGAVGIAHHGIPAEADGNITRTRLIGNFSAVSVSCMAIRKKLFDENQGFAGESFPNRLFDADLCLRLGKRKLRTVWTPHANLIVMTNDYRLNLQKPIPEDEAAIFEKKWRYFIERDPFHNPNLSKERTDFRIKEFN